MATIRIVLGSLRLLPKRRGTLPKILFFGYVLSLAVFSVLGDRGLWASARLWDKSRKLDVDVAALEADINTLRRQVELFRSDRRTIERFARDELRFSGDNEIHYLFP